MSNSTGCISFGPSEHPAGRGLRARVFSGFAGHPLRLLIAYRMPALIGLYFRSAFASLSGRMMYQKRTVGFSCHCPDADSGNAEGRASL
ncbi:hypothetical protein P3T36_006398 [Kitasatospora sp. MAP12-15]|uniref:hypothetical protein n=1 Tax=unclassified Kitasatospora TaxID=2633591 RepID=UPI003517AC1F